jgi:hypothetical protein
VVLEGAVQCDGEVAFVDVVLMAWLSARLFVGRTC